MILKESKYNLHKYNKVETPDLKIKSGIIWILSEKKILLQPK